MERHVRMVIAALLAAAIAGCAAGAPSPVPTPVPTPTPLPGATSFAEYGVSFCSAWEALFRAVGNPDTAEGSVLSKALDAAVASHDGKAADRLAAEITTELESGRRDVARGGGWPPAAPMMKQLDRVFVAFEAMTAAKRAAATRSRAPSIHRSPSNRQVASRRGPRCSRPTPQSEPSAPPRWKAAPTCRSRRRLGRERRGRPEGSRSSLLTRPIALG